MTWTNELITVSATEPAGAGRDRPATCWRWRDGATTTPTEPAQPEPVADEPVDLPAPEPVRVPPVTDLVGADEADAAGSPSGSNWPSAGRNCCAARVARPAGCLVSGPEGVGKATLVRAVTNAVGAALVELAAPERERAGGERGGCSRACRGGQRDPATKDGSPPCCCSPTSTCCCRPATRRRCPRSCWTRCGRPCARRCWRWCARRRMPARWTTGCASRNWWTVS